MISLPPALAEQKVPLSVAAGLIAVAIGLFMWGWYQFVHAEDFNRYKVQVERGRLETEQRAIERDIVKLEAKKAARPEQFLPEDKAVLEQSQRQNRRIEDELKSIRGF